MARGSGDHQEITGSDDQGKIPARYAVISVSGSSDPPVATRPESSCESTTSSLHAYRPMRGLPPGPKPVRARGFLTWEPWEGSHTLPRWYAPSKARRLPTRMRRIARGVRPGT